MHRDISVAEACAATCATKIDGLRDGVGGLLANRKEEPSLRGAEDRDLDAIDGGHVLEITEREVKALSGAGLCCVVRTHDRPVACRLAEKPTGHPIWSLVTICALAEDEVSLSAREKAARRLCEGKSACEEKEQNGEATHTNLLGSLCTPRLYSCDVGGSTGLTQGADCS